MTALFVSTKIKLLDSPERQGDCVSSVRNHADVSMASDKSSLERRGLYKRVKETGQAEGVVIPMGAGAENKSGAGTKRPQSGWEPSTRARE